MKTRRDYHKQTQQKAKTIPARIEAIGVREDAKCKTPGRDPMNQLTAIGRLKGRRVG